MDLLTPLFGFSNLLLDYFLLEDAVRHIQIFGTIGSSKTSGSFRTIFLSYLKKGMGGIVTTTKVTDKERILEYARLAGRSDDVIIFGPESGYRFNPLADEKNLSINNTFNIVSLFMLVIRMGERFNFSSGGQKKDDEFFENALKRLLQAAIDLLILANQPVNFITISKIISEAPVGDNIKREFYRMRNSADSADQRQLTEWCEESYTLFCLMWAADKVKTEDEKLAFDVLEQYFLIQFPMLPSNTRNSITETFFSFCNPFRSGLLAKCFSGETSPEIAPEVTFEGKIIILDFPVKELEVLAIYSQLIYKHKWQKAVEKRDKKRFPKPVFMMIDESQYYIEEKHDPSFFQTARESLACCVLCTQNISNYYTTIGGANPKYAIDAILGCIGTKIMHANDDPNTNNWGAELIGSTFKSISSFSSGPNGFSITEQRHYQIEPHKFNTLKMGGPRTDFKTEVIITSAGRTWSNGKNYLETYFDQKLMV